MYYENNDMRYEKKTRTYAKKEGYNNNCFVRNDPSFSWGLPIGA